MKNVPEPRPGVGLPWAKAVEAPRPPAESNAAIDLNAAEEPVELHEGDLQEVEDVTGLVQIEDDGTQPERTGMHKKFEDDETIEIDGMHAETLLKWEDTKAEIEPMKIGGYENADVHVGMKKKGNVSVSEDYVIAVPEYGIIGVADGVGSSGKNGAEVDGLNPAAQASRIIGKTFIENFAAIAETMKPAKAEEILKKAKFLDVPPDVSTQPEAFPIKREIDALKTADEILKDADQAKRLAAFIQTFALVQEEVKKTGGQSTACVALRHGYHMFIGNTGDSLAFIQRKNGELVQVTREDNALSKLQDANFPKSAIDRVRKDPKERLKISGRNVSYRDLVRSIIGVIGAEETRAVPNITILDIEPGDRLVTVTDGISDKFRTEDGSVDLERLTRYLGRNPKESPEDQIDVAINVAGVERTTEKVVDDDKAGAIMDIK